MKTTTRIMIGLLGANFILYPASLICLSAFGSHHDFEYSWDSEEVAEVVPPTEEEEEIAEEPAQPAARRGSLVIDDAQMVTIDKGSLGATVYDVDTLIVVSKRAGEGITVVVQ